MEKEYEDLTEEEKENVADKSKNHAWEECKRKLKEISEGSE